MTRSSRQIRGGEVNVSYKSSRSSCRVNSACFAQFLQSVSEFQLVQVAPLIFVTCLYLSLSILKFARPQTQRYKDRLFVSEQKSTPVRTKHECLVLNTDSCESTDSQQEKTPWHSFVSRS